MATMNRNSWSYSEEYFESSVYEWMINFTRTSKTKLLRESIVEGYREGA